MPEPGKRYVMRPTFVSNPGRVEALTREVQVIEDESPEGLILVENVEDGPYNDFLKKPLYTAGRTLVEAAKWRFTPVDESERRSVWDRL